ncbi:shikimate kinase [Staphylococcus pasteuri]|uniref:shikimate kinase n=1 Tax=Staphylococcus TaxID=1279 RepID=UPI0008683C57|nr:MULTISPECIES: shikimate kinase [Staphylococcus]MCO0860739.1 shikimate kinase [Staphylococcus pasteuri]MCO5359505.1 shikimate kinase [Staphylococcus pasteuri]ODB42043.1 shikimate kinase [Staphylococcus sp. AOAB]OFV06145.1 shikimate kinase [Staphylococcus sp. HMSC13A10]
MLLQLNKTPIILIGFMGTGKTTVGSYMRNQLNLSYVDLDQYIELKEHMTIPQIFDEKGETHFRDLEYKYLEDTLNKFDIISTGGGIIENQASLDLLKLQKNVIWLDCDIETVFERIVNDPHRPNANNKSLNQLKNLYSSRISRYNEIAFMKVNSNQNVSNIYQEITTSLTSD